MENKKNDEQCAILSLIAELERRKSYFNMTMTFNNGTQEGSVYQQAKTRVSEIEILLELVRKKCV